MTADAETSWIVTTSRAGRKFALAATAEGDPASMESVRLFLSQQHAERIARVLTENFGDPWTAEQA